MNVKNEKNEEWKSKIVNARSVDLVDLVRSCGYTPVRKSSKTYMLKEHDSFVIFRNTNTFYHYSQAQGGSPIDFLMKYNNMSLQEAVERLNNEAVAYTVSLQSKTSAQRHSTNNESIQRYDSAIDDEMVLPPPNENYRRVFAYLTKTRGITAEVVSFFMHEKRLFESSDHHNAVFVTYDDAGKAVYASQRGTLTAGRIFKGDVYGSDKRMGFPVMAAEKNNTLIVFEAPIDLMSFMSLYPDNKANLHAMGCLSYVSVKRLLSENPHISRISFVLDNDRNAPEVAAKAALELQADGYQVFEHEISRKLVEAHCKDVNDYLLFTKSLDREKKKAR